MYGGVLSLDTATNLTGYAFFEDEELVDSGVLDLSNIKYTEKRMIEMVRKIYGLISEYNPNTIVIENTVVMRNPKVQRYLTMILGAVFGKCASDDIDFISLRPTEWRKLADPNPKPKKRDELKQWSKDLVYDLFGLNVSDDESDAILIGYGFINSEK